VEAGGVVSRAGLPGTWHSDAGLVERAMTHAALGEPARLAIVEELVVSDRAPKELGERLGIPSNLLAHHLVVLEDAGLIERTASAGDGRRKYVHLVRRRAARFGVIGRSVVGEMMFVCTHNSARSQLAAALWTARTGRRARSAGTRPAARVHRGAIAAARRAGVSLADAVPSALDAVPAGVQVVTVCDLVHEELDAAAAWWHWSIPDPVERGDAAAFDRVVAELDERMASLIGAIDQEEVR
jgi:protein-tyrosine-phosphatase/DNA-binding HxlR family transcriptional regulator